jgi:hypothetical protein
MRALSICIASSVLMLAASAQGASPTEIEITFGSNKVLGRPLSWTPDRVFLLARDGRLWDCAPAEAKDYRQSTEQFRSLTKNEMRGQLQREFGQAFDVTSTGNYLVVHPAGEESKWAQRFETLYRSFLHYFQARGMRLQAPIFPLVAVVFPRQEDFMRFAASEGDSVSPNVLGYYSPRTNRIIMFDRTGGQGGDWTQNAETLIHEAAHQTAFNTGIHSRWSSPPRWVAEGLGTMFEAPGVYDAPKHTSQTSRLNRGRLEAFKAFAGSRRPKGNLAAIVGSDRAFSADADGGYAEAWALTFYLAETEPRKYFAYLEKTASHAPFIEVTGPERLKDFTSVFGSQLDLLEAKMLRFVGELK